MNLAFIRKNKQMCKTDTKYTESKKGSFPNSLILIACTWETFKACVVVYYCVTESMEVPRLIGVVSPQKMRSNALLPSSFAWYTLHITECCKELSYATVCLCKDAAWE